MSNKNQNNLKQPPKKLTKKKTRIVWGGFILRIILLLIIAVFGYAGFILNKIDNIQETVIEKESQNDQAGIVKILSAAKSMIKKEYSPLKGEENKRINLLLLGLGGEGHKGENLTDTIILASINPETYESAMISLPRDLYVQIPDTNYHTKINAVYTYALNQKEKEPVKILQEVVEKITGQEIQYYAIVDFEGFKKIINDLDGIEIEVENDIYDPKFPGPNYSYEIFEIKKGFHKMDAETALKYARVRHTSGGDFARAKRQQQVLSATKRKALSLGTLANPYKITNLLENLGDHLKTNIQIKEIPSFVRLANNINIHQTTNKVIDAWQKDSLLAVTHVPLGGVNAFALIPRSGNYQEIQDISKNIFNLPEIEKRNEIIKKEQASLLIIPQKQESYQKARRIINEFNYEADFNFEENFTCPNDNTIYDISDNKKLFSLDNLTKKFNAKIELDQAKVSEVKTFFYPELAEQPKEITSISELIRAQETEDSTNRDQSATPEPKTTKKYDFIICLSQKTLDFFEKQEQVDREELENQNILDENGNVMINQEN